MRNDPSSEIHEIPRTMNSWLPGMHAKTLDTFSPRESYFREELEQIHAHHEDRRRHCCLIGDHEGAKYHEERRNVALLALMGPRP